LQTFTTKVQALGRVVIPKLNRAAEGIDQGDSVLVTVTKADPKRAHIAKLEKDNATMRKLVTELWQAKVEERPADASEAAAKLLKFVDRAWLSNQYGRVKLVVKSSPKCKDCGATLQQERT